MKKPLHLARNLGELNSSIESKSYGKKLELLCKVSNTLYLQAEKLKSEEIIDEELLYVISSRYLNLANTIRLLVKDEKFYTSLFSKPVAIISKLKSDLQQSLEFRYETANVIIDHPLEEVQDAITALDLESAKSTTTKNMFASCEDLFKLINDSNIRLLILDARSEQDFKESRIKFVSAINIPDNVIRPGLSTNTLQQKLDGESLAVFKRRHSYNAIVLYDFDTDRLSFPSSKLEELRTILVDWELEEQYKAFPYILNGGLRLWTETYPTFVTNPAKIFNTYFGTLDDIMLEINYPDYDIVEAIEAPPAEMPPEIKTNDYPVTNMLQAITTLAEHQLENEELLLELTEKRCTCYRDMIRIKEVVAKVLIKLKNLNIEISKAESFKTEVTERRSVLDAEFSTLKGNTEMHLVTGMISAIAAIDRKRLARFQTRRKLETSVDGLKKKFFELAKPPQIPDRKYKPDTKKAPLVPSQELYRRFGNYPDPGNFKPDDNLKFKPAGVTGIKNVRNTCYMNSVVQSLRFCPEFFKYMSETRFTSENFRGHDVSFSRSLADLLQILWTDSKSSVHPGNFYMEVCNPGRRDKPFGMGSHEDVQEFFLFMLEVMHGELGIPIQLHEKVPEGLRDLHKQYSNRVSIVSKSFNFQVTTSSTCPNCKKSIVRYEYGNTVFVPLPANGLYVHLEEHVRAVLDVNPEEVDSNKFCRDCERQRIVKKTITYYPTILTVTIIRYVYSSACQGVLRVNNEVYFPEELYFGTQKYELKSMALHVGNKDQGHYTAVCLHPDQNKWYEYNDEKTKVANIAEPTYRIKCYLLFYCLKQSHEEVNKYFY